MDSFEHILPLLDSVSYLGIFLVIVFSGYVIPIPEELFLILIGYLIYAGVFSPIPVLVVALLAAITHDHLLFRLGRIENERAKWFLEQITQWTLLNREELVKNHLLRVVFYTRFIPYVRMAGPLLAGFHGVPWKKFAVVNAAAVVLYTPLSILAGYHFHGAIEQVLARVTIVHHVVLITVLLCVGVSVGWYIGKALGLEKKLIAVMELRLQTWLPLLVLLLLLGGYSLLVRTPDVSTLSYEVGSSVYADTEGRFTLLYPRGFAVVATSSMFGTSPIVVLSRGNDDVPDEVAVRAHPLMQGGSSDEVIVQDAATGDSGRRITSVRDLTEMKIAGRQWFYTRRFLQEGQLSVTYYTVDSDTVYSATLLEDGIIDWMDPSFDEFGTSGHRALHFILSSLSFTHAE